MIPSLVGVMTSSYRSTSNWIPCFWVLLQWPSIRYLTLSEVGRQYPTALNLSRICPAASRSVPQGLYIAIMKPLVLAAASRGNITLSN